MARARNALIVLGISTAIAAAATTRHHLQMLSGEGVPLSYHTWPHAMIQEMPYFYLWALAVPLVFWFVRWIAQRQLPTMLMIGAHVVFASAVVVVEGTLAPLVRRLLGESPSVDLAKALGAGFEGLPTQILTYGAVLGGVLAYGYYRRLADRELAAANLTAELAEARLGALRAQLHPHFVFNALNSVAMLVRGQRNTAAVDAIAGLSDLLRDTLEDDDRAEVTLDEEMAFVRRYLAIEQIRFGDRLQVAIDVPAGLGNARVPRLVLQPLVENAIRHGIGRRAAAGHVRISAVQQDGRLAITVQDDGPGPGAANGTRGHGVGLSNTRNRLAALYGDDGRVTLEEAPDGGAVATVSFPLSGFPEIGTGGEA